MNGIWMVSRVIVKDELGVRVNEVPNQPCRRNPINSWPGTSYPDPISKRLTLFVRHIDRF
jgi:hypothetical protein